MKHIFKFRLKIRIFELGMKNKHLESNLGPIKVNGKSLKVNCL